jgi:hypothetical protein
MMNEIPIENDFARQSEISEYVKPYGKRIRQLENQIEHIHKILDQDGVQIIRNEKDGYPEGRPDRNLTLSERVQAACRMIHDWHRWHNELEEKFVEVQLDKKRLDCIIENGLNVYFWESNHRWSVRDNDNEISVDEYCQLRKAIDEVINRQTEKKRNES